MKREFSLFLAIFLIIFLFLPQTVFAEEINLSNNDILKLFPSLQNGVMEQWINLTSSGAFDEPEKQAVFYLIRGAIQKKQLNYILVDLPKEGLIKLYQLGVFLMGAPDASAIFSKIEKLTVEQAVNTAKEWFLQNQTKVATGTLNYSFKSYNGNQQNTTFYYNLVYKPRGNNYIDLAIEFYSPENIEPKDSVDYIVGLNTWCWDFNDWQKKGDKYIKPFIFKIKGRILHHDQGDYYTWEQTLSSEITFPESVPKIEVAKQPTILDQIKEGLTKKFVENVLHIPYDWFKIAQDKIVDFIKTSILKQNNPPKKAEITEVLSSAIDQKIITPEKIIEIVQTEIEENEAPKTQISTESKPKISLEEAQEILDDIAEKIDILTQQVKELNGVKTIANTENLIIEEENKKLDQEKEEETEEIEEVLEEEVQEKEKTPVPSIAICQKTAGYYPLHNSIVLNEIAWMGTTTSFNNEWIELKNMSSNPVDLAGWQLLDKDQNIKIVFTDRGRAPAKGFYLLERSNDDAVPGISADFIYTGSLNNSNEALYLFDPSCQLQDEIEVFLNWPAGDNDSKRTIERKGNFEWQTSSYINGTPKSENGSGYVVYSHTGGSGGISLDIEPPIANAGFEQSVIINEPITFDASVSSDNIGIVSYQWDVDVSDGLDWENPDLTGKNPILETGYSEVSNYTVTLQIADAAGNSATDTLTITVNPPPKILISEVFFDAEGSDEGKEFIELHNPNDLEVNPSNWSIQYLSPSVTSVDEIKKKNFEENNKIEIKGYFLIGLNGREDDLTWSQALGNQGGTIFLVNDKSKITGADDENIVDQIGYGAGEGLILPEGLVFSLENFNPGKSLGRKWSTGTEGYLDTDNNQEDFEIQTPTPKAKNQSLPEDTTPPEISNIQVSDITETSALINWETKDEKSTSIIEYGTNADYGETKSSDDYLLSHGISLTDLESGTTYRYRVGSNDEKGNTSWSEDNTFTTTPSNPITTIFEDDFDAYNLGDLAGQGGWTSSGDSYQVTEVYSYSGSKSIIGKMYYVSYVTKTGNNVAEGEMAIAFYIATPWRDYWDSVLTFRQGQGGSTLGNVIFRPMSDNSIYLGETNLIYSNVSADVWHILKIQWSSQTDKMRIKLDDLDWSNWYAVGGTVDYINTLDISCNSSGTLIMYFDMAH